MNPLTKIAMTLALTAPVVLANDVVSASTTRTTHPRSEQSLLRMAERIERAVLRTPAYGLFDEIRFTISDNVVTLKGFASRPTLRDNVEQAVRRIEGVENVVNEIEELPVNSFDEDIRFRAYTAIYLDPWLSRYNPNRGTPIVFSPGAIAQGISLDPPIGYHPIHIIVRNGHVRLTGVVATAGDRILAGILVNNLPGTFQVENDLAVAEEAKPIRGAQGTNAK